MFAFRISAHAEIEGFIEYCAETLMTHLATKNNAKTLAYSTQKALLLYKDMNKQFPPQSISFQVPSGGTADKIRSVLNAVESSIATNNGVSEKDILKLFVPLGVSLNFFEENWLRSMTDLARARGEAAHNSWVSSNTVQQPDPITERSRLVLPLRGIGKLVDELERLRAVA
ncbi:HEPN domain-containing protein [Lentzea sp. NBRC 102530]|uniref:HEPN domain-containing protein n=1 Tax=Lentzea sp. NBRC 102530 TaxID=3032201 RepID=UPI0025525C23|nr:HEPN domain-containing protein [Lentzea sp. NBRC 102530]